MPQTDDTNLTQNEAKLLKPSHPSFCSSVLKIILFGIVVFPIFFWFNYFLHETKTEQLQWTKNVDSAVLWQKLNSLREATLRALPLIIAVEEKPRIHTIQGVELGQHLLALGDPSGAEAICIAATRRDGDDMKAWTCLGEARLALYNSAWKSNVSGKEENRRLKSSRRNFETAVGLDPTFAEARLGLGLSLFLLGTRVNRIKDESLESSTQLLFDAILHLNAAAALTSSFIEEKGKLGAKMEQLHVAASYNSGLAYLALGDSASALSPLRKTVSLVNQKNQSGISLPTANLGALLLHRGAAIDAISLTNVTAMKYCKGEVTGMYGSSSYFDGENVLKKIRTHKSCSVLLNNLEVAEEIMDRTISKGKCNGYSRVVSYEAAVRYEKKLALGEETIASLNNAELLKKQVPYLTNDDKDDSNYTHEKPINQSNVVSEDSKLIDNVEQDAERLNVDFKRNDEEDTGTENEDSMNMDTTKEMESIDDEVVQNEKNTSVETNHYATTDSKSSEALIKVAVEALEKAVLKDPSRALMWLSLSRVKLQVGDKSGAVEAGAKALNVAVGVDEIEASTAALEEALKYVVNRDDGVWTRNQSPSSQGDDLDVKNEKILNLEREILNVKLKLLQYSSLGFEMPNSDQPYQPPDQNIFDDAIDDIADKHEILKAEHIGTIDNGLISGSVPEVVLVTGDNTVNEKELNESDTELLDISKKEEFDVSPPEILFNNSIIEHSEDPNRPSENDVIDEEKIEQLHMPPLYNPTLIDRPENVSRTALSYMRVADAYFEKNNFKMASKQFFKVIKKAPNYIPAELGYATSFERWAKNKQIGEVATAYVNVTKSALSQDERILAENTYRRAIEVISRMETGRIKALRSLSIISFTYLLSSETYYKIGLELLKRNETDTHDQEEAVTAFKLSNGFSALDEENEVGFYSKSMFQLGKIALDSDNNAKDALSYFDSTLMQENLDNDIIVEGLVLSGEAKERLGNTSDAIDSYRKAIDLPKTEFTATAHYHLGLALKKANLGTEDIERHIELSLELGVDPTPEAIDILGENHIAVMKAINRVEWRRYRESSQKELGRGGIMNGSENFSKESIFSPQRKEIDQSSEQSQTLSIIEQGAASYDGDIPSGEEIMDSETVSDAARQQSSARKKARQS